MIRYLYLGIGIEDWDQGLESGIRNGIELEDWDRGLELGIGDLD